MESWRLSSDDTSIKSINPVKLSLQDGAKVKCENGVSVEVLDLGAVGPNTDDTHSSMTVDEVISISNTKNCYKCDSCGQELLGSYNLKVHLLKHLQNARHSIVSNKTSDSKALVNKDGEISTEADSTTCNVKLKKGDNGNSKSAPFTCEECGKECQTSNLFRQHMYKHRGENCKYCGKRLASKTALMWHENAHEGIMNFQCSMCEKSFVSKSRLKQHMDQIHHDEEDSEHECNLCHKIYKRSYLLKRHLVKHHKELENEMHKQTPIDNSITAGPAEINEYNQSRMSVNDGHHVVEEMNVQRRMPVNESHHDVEEMNVQRRMPVNDGHHDVEEMDVQRRMPVNDGHHDVEEMNVQRRMPVNDGHHDVEEMNEQIRMPVNEGHHDVEEMNVQRRMPVNEGHHDVEEMNVQRRMPVNDGHHDVEEMNVQSRIPLNDGHYNVKEIDIQNRMSVNDSHYNVEEINVPIVKNTVQKEIMNEGIKDLDKVQNTDCISEQENEIPKQVPLDNYITTGQAEVPVIKYSQSRLPDSHHNAEEMNTAESTVHREILNFKDVDKVQNFDHISSHILENDNSCIKEDLTSVNIYHNRGDDILSGSSVESNTLLDKSTNAGQTSAYNFGMSVESLAGMKSVADEQYKNNDLNLQTAENSVISDKYTINTSENDRYDYVNTGLNMNAVVNISQPNSSTDFNEKVAMMDLNTNSLEQQFYEGFLMTEESHRINLVPEVYLQPQLKNAEEIQNVQRIGPTPYTCTSHTGHQNQAPDHPGEKKNQCRICQKLFSSKGNLNRHLKIHAKQSSTSTIQKEAVAKIVSSKEVQGSDICHNQSAMKMSNAKALYTGNQHSQQSTSNDIQVNSISSNIQPNGDFKHLTDKANLKYSISETLLSNNHQTDTSHKYLQQMQLPSSSISSKENVINDSSGQLQRFVKDISKTVETKEHVQLTTDDGYHLPNPCPVSDSGHGYGSQQQFQLPKASPCLESDVPREKRAKDEKKVSDKIFEILRDYKRQVAEQALETSYQCDICKKVLRTKNNLNRHIKTHALESNESEIYNRKETNVENQNQITGINENSLQLAGDIEAAQKLNNCIGNEQDSDMLNADNENKANTHSAVLYKPISPEGGKTGFGIQQPIGTQQSTIQWPVMENVYLIAEPVTQSFVTLEPAPGIVTGTIAGTNLNTVDDNKPVDYTKLTGTKSTCYPPEQILVNNTAMLGNNQPNTNVAGDSWSSSSPSKDEEKTHKCPVCSKSFKHPYSLVRHSSIHSSENSNKCEICGKIFSTKSNLSRHSKIHETTTDDSVTSTVKERDHDVTVNKTPTQEVISLNPVVYENSAAADQPAQIYDNDASKQGYETNNLMATPSYEYINTNALGEVDAQAQTNYSHLTALMQPEFSLNLPLYANAQSEQEIDMINQQFSAQNTQALNESSLNETCSLLQVVVYSNDPQDEVNMISASEQETFETNTITYDEMQLSDEPLVHFDSQMKEISNVFECEVCYKTYDTQDALTQHSLSHSREGSHACATCGLSYKSDSELKIHLKTHSGKQQKYYCDICKKGWVHSFELKRHMVVHTTEKPHPCTHCNTRFKRFSDLKRHIRVRHADKCSDTDCN